MHHRLSSTNRYSWLSLKRFFRQNELYNIFL
jgi:hypothetical protein